MSLRGWTKGASMNKPMHFYGVPFLYMYMWVHVPSCPLVCFEIRTPLTSAPTRYICQMNSPHTESCHVNCCFRQSHDARVLAFSPRSVANPRFHGGERNTSYEALSRKARPAIGAPLPLPPTPSGLPPPVALPPCFLDLHEVAQILSGGHARSTN